MPLPVELLRFFDRATTSAVPAAQEAPAAPATATDPTPTPLGAGILVPDSSAALSHSNSDRS